VLKTAVGRVARAHSLKTRRPQRHRGAEAAARPRVA
jgi:hypothetical protein